MAKKANIDIAREQAQILMIVLRSVINFILDKQHIYANKYKACEDFKFTSISHMLSFLTKEEKYEYDSLVNSVIYKSKQNLFMDIYGNVLYFDRKKINRLINKYLTNGQKADALMNKNSLKDNIAGFSLGQRRSLVIKRMIEIIYQQNTITTDNLLCVLVSEGLIPVKEDGTPLISRSTLQKIREENNLSRRDIKMTLRDNTDDYLRVNASYPFESLQADIKYLPMNNVVNDDGERVQIYFIGLIDDYSRFVFGLFAYNQHQESVNALLYKVFKEYGLPKAVLCDNGSVYRSKSFTNIFTNLGIDLRYCKVRTPETKGKIERFNRTLDEFVSSILPNKYTKTLASVLITKANDFLYRYNYETIHSETKETPAQRLTKALEDHKLRQVDSFTLEYSFYEKHKRHISSTGVISYKNKSFKVQRISKTQSYIDIYVKPSFNNDIDVFQLVNEDLQSRFVKLEPFVPCTLEDLNDKHNKAVEQIKEEVDSQPNTLRLNNFFNALDLAKSREIWKKHHKKHDEIDFLRFFAKQNYDFETQVRLEVLIALETDRGLPNEILSSITQQCNIDINTGLDIEVEKKRGRPKKEVFEQETEDDVNPVSTLKRESASKSNKAFKQYQVEKN